MNPAFSVSRGPKARLGKQIGFLFLLIFFLTGSLGFSSFESTDERWNTTIEQNASTTVVHAGDGNCIQNVPNNPTNVWANMPGTGCWAVVETTAGGQEVETYWKLDATARPNWINYTIGTQVVASNMPLCPGKADAPLGTSYQNAGAAATYCLFRIVMFLESTGSQNCILRTLTAAGTVSQTFTTFQNYRAANGGSTDYAISCSGEVWLEFNWTALSVNVWFNGVQVGSPITIENLNVTGIYTRMRSGFTVGAPSHAQVFGYLSADNITILNLAGDLPGGPGNPFQASINYASEGWGFDVSWLFGIVVVVIFTTGLGKATNGSVLGIALGAFLGIGVGVIMGLFPLWLLLVVIFLIIAVAGTRLFGDKSGDESA